MKKNRIPLIVLGSWLLILILVVAVFGWSRVDNNEFQPQNEFKLDAWIPIKIGSIDLSVNRAVFYLLLASGLTIGTMVWIARRMRSVPYTRSVTSPRSRASRPGRSRAGPSARFA